MKILKFEYFTIIKFQNQLRELIMSMSNLFLEIFNNYQAEYSKDNKTSNPYFANLKNDIISTFDSMANKFNIAEIATLGGQGISRKNPYIVFLSTSHKTSKGFYPSFSFNLDEEKVVLGLGDSYDNPIDAKLKEKLISRSKFLLPDFKGNKEIEYPHKVYNKSSLNDAELMKDLEMFLQVYNQLLEEFNIELDEFLHPNLQKDKSDDYDFSFTDDDIQEYLEVFFNWFRRQPDFINREQVSKYSKYSKTYFQELSDAEFVEEIFQFARDGGMIQSGGARTAGNLRKSIEGDIGGFRKLVLDIFSNDFDLKKWWEIECKKFKYFGKGIRSILLHRIFPKKYAIYNNKSWDTMVQLELLPERMPRHSFAYGLLSEAVDKLISKRPNELNYYTADLFTHFFMTADESGEIWEKIENRHRAKDGVAIEIEKNQIDYWLIAPGEKALYWNDFLNNGIAAIGWDFLGDLSNYNTKEDILEKLNEHYGDKVTRKNNAHACWEFTHVLKPGDIIIAKKGKTKYLGYGIVTSDYIFDNKRPGFKSLRKVNWVKHGEWIEKDGLIVTKAFTGISKYPEYVEKIINLMDIKETAPIGETSYWWLNANPRIWDLAGAKLGETQTYTALNERGNKRQKYKYFTQVKPGDKILGYIATPALEISAICEVTKPLHETPEGMAFEFKKIEHLSHPLSYATLKQNPDLKNCEPIISNQGSLFRVTQEEYEIIQSVIDDFKPPVLKEPLVKYKPTDALKDLFVNESSYNNILNILKRKKNIILQGPPGVGKTFVAKRIAYSFLGFKDDSKVETIQFHQSYSYEDFIQGYRPNSDGKFDLINGIFFNFCKKAQRDENNNYFFIIDEINRGNLSKIFGELMMLIEHDKRGEEFSIPLTYSSSSIERFSIPSNLHIIGTMNTADRSLALVDYALRRRFSFIDLNPVFDDKFQNYLHDQGVTKSFAKEISEKLTRLNNKITMDNKNLGKGYCIGHSYFCSFDSASEKEWYKTVIKTEIEPLLKEYWFDDENKVENAVKELLA